MIEPIAQALVDTTALLEYLAIDLPDVFQASVQFLLSTGTVVAECAEIEDPAIRERLARLLEQKKIFRSSPSLDALVQATTKWDLADHLSAGEISVLAAAEQIEINVMTDDHTANRKATEHLGRPSLSVAAALKKAFGQGLLKADDLESIKLTLEAVLKHRF